VQCIGDLLCSRGEHGVDTLSMLTTGQPLALCQVVSSHAYVGPLDVAVTTPLVITVPLRLQCGKAHG